MSDRSTETSRSFARDGYVVLPGVLTEAEVDTLRGICGARLTAKGTEEMLPAEFLSVPELAGLPFRDDVIGVLKDLLGDDVAVYPNVTVRKDLYVGWHIDEAFIGAGREYVWSPAFRHVQGAFYLQENTDESGGGLDVVPGSHLTSLDGYGRVQPDLESATAITRSTHGTVTIRSRPGDLVLWHARLIHASTGAGRPVSGPAKFGVFFSATASDPYAQNRYLTHLLSKRVLVVDGEPVEQPRHAAVLDIRWPASYPDWLRDQIAKAGVTAATF